MENLIIQLTALILFVKEPLFIIKKQVEEIEKNSGASKINFHFVATIGNRISPGKKPKTVQNL